MKRLALPGLPRILAEPDADPLAVLCGGIEQQSLYVTRVRPPAHHIQEPSCAWLPPICHRSKRTGSKKSSEAPYQTGSSAEEKGFELSIPLARESQAADP